MVTDSASIQATCPKGEQKITVMLKDLDVDYYGGGWLSSGSKAVLMKVGKSL